VLAELEQDVADAAYDQTAAAPSTVSGRRGSNEQFASRSRSPRSHASTVAGRPEALPSSA
jgi:hypothetical protein